jgi:undecaprenyl-diphosphatase
MELWQAVVLGLVEGITEYLPISSTGHLILASGLMGLDTLERKEALDDFLIVVQGGAILAVIALYWPSVARMLRGLAGRDPGGIRLLVNLIAAFIPAAVVGLALEDAIEQALFRPGPVLSALVLGGVFMLLLTAWQSGRIAPVRSSLRDKTLDDLTISDAFIVGLLQCIALWPGMSRSMVTIAGGMIVGLRPARAAEFSFLLGLPTLCAATLYKLAKDLLASSQSGTPNLFQSLGILPCLVGLVVAAVSAAVAVRWLVAFLSRHGLTLFGWYRIALAIFLLAMLRLGWVTIEQTPDPPTDRTQEVAEPVRWL